MKNRVRRYGTLFLIALLSSLFIFQLDAVGQKVLSENMDTAEFAQVRIQKLRQAAKELQGLAAEPLPENLLDEEKTEAMRSTRWLISSGRKLTGLAARWQNSLNDIGMIQSRVLSLKRMQETNSAFNREYAVLRDELVHEWRQHASISHLMKGNYATAQHSISSLR
jgi:hypothetical protein